MSAYTSRDFSRPEHLQFVKELEQASPSGSKAFYTLFEDFLTLSWAALAQLVHRMQTMAQGSPLDEKIEAEYMRVVKQYKPEQVKHFAAAMGIMTQSLQSEGGVHDFLGEVYGRTGISNKWGGQFFTPWPICQLMAKFTLGDELPEHRITIQEPAVGGGAMLLAIAEEMRVRELSARRWWFDATDVDIRCARMAYVQLSTIDAPGIVRHGNTISGDQYAAWLTPAGALFPMRWEKREQPESDPIAVPSVAAQKEATQLVEEQLQLL